MLLQSETYKEPEYALLNKEGNIEIRQYDEYIVAKASVESIYKDDNNMFRTLASYIFGGNKENKSIPMTAPVTTYEDTDSYNMIFYMLDANDINEMPKPNGQDISFEKFNPGKCVVISFSWFTTDNRIKSYTRKLKKYISNNNLEQKSSFMVNRYDPPWRLPFMRRNEVLVQIN
tara:strand:+ start:770 stop:1291 length:522 start_codon:yes stop_codon:yes gene_type:complete